MARPVSIRPALTLRGREFRGVRGWAGKPTHPPLTDFPIVGYVLAAVFDIISSVAHAGDSGSEVARDFFRAATFVIVAGAVVAVPTALTGFWDWWKGLERDPSTGVIGRAKRTQVWRTVNWHAAVMLTSTAIVVVDIVVRLIRYDDGYTNIAVLILSVVAAGLVAFGAAYGGALVYEYQFNVESLKGRRVWDESESDEVPGRHETHKPSS
jgi:uncharacterized membrane protein